MELPFGKYKGRSMNEVPAEYLLELHDNSRSVLNQFPEVMEYIKDNLKRLRDEY